MLDRAKHEIRLKNILRDIYLHPALQAQLVFKGGTCLYLFHELPRFSTDLDFSLISGVDQSVINPESITAILSQYLEIREFTDKRFTLLWSGNYEKGLLNIKVEISKRKFPDKYIIEDFLGIPIRTLDMGSMFAHKLCAITDRRQLVPRDLYDTWWLLKKLTPINDAIILQRTGKSTAEYLKSLLEFIPENTDQRHIVFGLGELLDRSQKDWVRDHLYTELMAQITMRMDAEKAE